MQTHRAALVGLVAVFTLGSEASATVAGRLPGAFVDQTSCENQVPLFDSSARDQIAARIKTAYQYHMTSTDPAAQGTYEQRLERFNTAATADLRAFRDLRRSQYQATVCRYDGSRRTSGRGARSATTLTVAEGQYLLRETLERTTNGDWKGGPNYGGPADAPTSITWVTGGYRPARTFVRIQAKYSESFIRTRVQQELADVRRVLADANIPTPDVTSG